VSYKKEMTMSVKEQVIEIISRTLDIEKSELSGDTSLYAGAGVDSTEMVEITVALAKALDVKLAQGDISNKSTIDDIAATIEKKKQS